MNRIKYATTIKKRENNVNYNIDIDRNGQLVSLKNLKDRYNMEWLNNKEKWGKIVAPDNLTVYIDRLFTQEGHLREIYTFSNETEFDVFIMKNEIGIYTTLPDDYESSEKCMKERCHVHIWCGKETTYLYGLRMGGEAPHLGLILNSGSIDGYSIVRNEAERSNDRGCIILHPESFHLKPRESITISWDLVWFNKQEDFFNIIKTYKNTILVSIEKPLSFKGEQMQIQIESNCRRINNKVKIYKNDKEVAQVSINESNQILVNDESTETGKIDWRIQVNNYETIARTLVLPEIDKLAQERCKYIVQKQQFHNKDSNLNGAFLIYDTVEEVHYYSHHPDHNGGRERIGMGVLLAKYLQKNKDKELEIGLDKYTEYIHRELFDADSGTVYNDIGRNNDWHRLYNYPWMASFFIERYHLYHEENDLKNMYMIMKAYYRNGGDSFYAIDIPVIETVRLLSENGKKEESEVLKTNYCKHAEYILKKGINYPAHEVNYEQSIVAPAVSILLQVYLLTKDEKYLKGAKKQLDVLILFNGKQPDYHLYETAIRHWDGFWFGKSKLYGDTFPHYWSALSGNVFLLYWQVTKDRKFLYKARTSLRGTLSLFSESGRASCAYIYPQTINGKQGDFADVWANDQDWALYYYLKYQSVIEK